VRETAGVSLQERNPKRSASMGKQMNFTDKVRIFFKEEGSKGVLQGPGQNLKKKRILSWWKPGRRNQREGEMISKSKHEPTKDGARVQRGIGIGFGSLRETGSQGGRGGVEREQQYQIREK